jgi:hypothetical protein
MAYPANFVNKNTGQPQAATVDDAGVVQTNAIATGDIEIGAVEIKDGTSDQRAEVDGTGALKVAASVSVTTTSGTPMYADIINFPTVQSVSVLNQPTTVSGTEHIVINFPTIQTVNVLNQPTTVSGTEHVTIDNLPTVQTVNVLNQPTTVSGTEHVVIDNLPTVQTVNVNNLPNVTLNSPLPIDYLNNQTRIRFAYDFADQETGAAVYTPNSGKKFVLTDLTITTTASGVITVYDNTDDITHRIEKLFSATYGQGGIWNYTMPYQSTAANNVLKITTVSGCYGSIKGHVYEI